MRTVLHLKVKPNARVRSLVQAEDGTWIAQLKSPPIDGKANAELIALLAEHFSCRKAEVEITAGAGARLKRVVITH